MEYAEIQVKVPKEMQIFFSDDYVIGTDDELKRNACYCIPIFTIM